MNRIVAIVLFCFLQSGLSAQFIESHLETGIDQLSFSRGRMGGGAVFFDYNNDGFEDLYMTGGNFPDKLYQNFGDGTFFDVSNQSSVTRYTETYYTDAVISGDVNNDGCEDLFVTSFPHTQRNILLINNCDGTFTNKGFSAGIIETSSSLASAFIDYNKDGLLDIYVVNYIDFFDFIADENNIIIGVDRYCLNDFFYINNGDLTFTESSQELQINNGGCGLAVLPTDVDYDGDQDLYLGNDHGPYVVPNTLYRNDYPANQFTDFSVESGLDVGMFAMGIAVGDYNEDGYQDYYVSNLGNNAFLENNGDHTFRERAVELGVENGFHHDSISVVSWGTFFFDHDNDTDLDLFVANGYLTTGFGYYTVPRDTNRLFQNQGDGSFVDLTAPLGLLNDEKHRGAIYGDYDWDGDLDIVLVQASSDSADRSAIYKNLTSGNNWIHIKLEGDESINRNAFGSILTVYKDGRKFIRELSSGGTYASQHSQYLHFGMASYNSADSVRIKWPDKSLTTFYDVEVNQRYFVQKETETLEVMGCMDPDSPNYNPAATYNSGCLTEKIMGCMDPEANNFDPEANFSYGCDYSVEEEKKEIITGIENKHRNFSIYPNPFKDYINLNILPGNQKLSLRVIDLTGREVSNKELILKDKIRYDMPNLKSGIYFLVITDNNKEVLFTKKIIKRN